MEGNNMRLFQELNKATLLTKVAGELLAYCAKSEDKNIRSKVILFERDEDLDELVNDTCWEIRREVALVGRMEDLEILVNDVDDRVREAVAIAAVDVHNNKRYFDKLVKDKSWIVRCAVAESGIDKYLQLLKDDRNEAVRETVAYYLESNE